MGVLSSIEWTNATWNPWQGCTRVSPACKYCYMFSDLKRYGRDGSIVVRSKPATFGLPIKRKRDGQYAIAPGSKIFTCSWSDWFHQAADSWRDEAWEIIRRRPDVTFQIVTKRTERIAECLPADWWMYENGFPNVWLIATVENQEYAEIRIPELVEIPAVVHGLSCEPLLGPIDILPWTGRLQWVIAGGESGSKEARPTHPDWVYFLRNQCSLWGVPFFFKQWGEWLPIGEYDFFSLGMPEGRFDDIDMLPSGKTGSEVTRDVCLAEETLPTLLYRVGKKRSGRKLEEREWSQFPAMARAL